jgi:carbonic anhydrase/acetyltransferase-like protein (isoleucine patch superfamily)
MPFIHETAVVLGDVILGDSSSVWPTAVIRGDVERISIGARSNVQDGAVIHADPGFPTVIGEDCVIGHRAIIHGTVLGHRVLVGMGAILLNGVDVGAGSIIGAGAVVTQGTQIPPGSMVLGVPARIIRATSESEQASILQNAARYVALAGVHASGRISRQK